MNPTHATVGTLVRLASAFAEGDTATYRIATPHEGKGRVDIEPVEWDGPLAPLETVTLEMIELA